MSQRSSASRSCAGSSPRASTRADRLIATVRSRPARAPARQLAQRDLEHVQRQRHDQPGLLGDRDELVGRHRPPVFVGPASERLDARHRAGLRAVLRLEDDLDCSRLDRARADRRPSSAAPGCCRRPRSSSARRDSRCPSPGTSRRRRAASASRSRGRPSGIRDHADARVDREPDPRDLERLGDARAQLCADRSAPARCRASTTIANSSPPSRATVSPSRSPRAGGAQPRAAPRRPCDGRACR